MAPISKTNPSAQVIMYNSVQLEYNRLSFNQRPVLDTDGRSVMYMETTYQVSGVVYRDNASDLPTKLLNLRKDLAVAQKPLWISEYEITGPATGTNKVLADSDTRGSATDDVNNGAIPGPFQVQEIPGGVMALYQWSVTVFEPPGKATDTFNADHEGFSFSCNTAVDGDGFPTRSVQGKLTIGADKIPADQYREAIVKLFTQPGTNWRRISQTFDQSEDGRVLAFGIQDRYSQHPLPSPVTSGEATYTTSIMPKTCMVEFALAGTFSCPGGTDKQTVFTQIMALAKVKIPGWDQLQQPTASTGARGFLMGCTITESLYATNEISFRIWGHWPWKRDLTKPAVNMFTAPPTGTQSIPDADPTNDKYSVYSETPNNPLGKLASVDLTASTSTAISNPAAASGVANTVPSPVGDPTGGDSTGSPTPTASTGTTSTTPADDPAANLSEEEKANPYVSFNEVISYCFDEGKAILLPKDSATLPFVQQAHPRTLTITQAGYAIRYEATPKAPTPIYPDTDRDMLWFDVQRGVPQPQSPWVMSQSVAWCYVMQYTKVAKPDLDLAKVPNDPRFTTQSQDTFAMQGGGKTIDTVTNTTNPPVATA